MKNNSFVTVIIVTYNGGEYIGHCLKSLLKQDYPKDKYEIIIVDNASTDSTVNNVKNFKDVKLIENNTNEGFGRANNLALRQCKGDYAILLNQDGWVEKNFVSELVGVMSKNNRIGICGAAEHPYDTVLSSNRKTEETHWIGCGATIVRVCAVQAVGFFDENYFMYQEDIDLSLKLRCNGWKVYYHPNAIWHHAGRNRKLEQTSFRIVESSVSRIYLLLKFGSFKQILSSFRLYFSRTKKSACVSSNAAAGTEQKNDKKSFVSVIALRACLKIIPALVQRWKVRQSQLFDKQMVDDVIKETDGVLYAGQNEGGL